MTCPIKMSNSISGHIERILRLPSSRLMRMAVLNESIRNDPNFALDNMSIKLGMLYAKMGKYRHSILRFHYSKSKRKVVGQIRITRFYLSK